MRAESALPRHSSRSKDGQQQSQELVCFRTEIWRIAVILIVYSIPVGGVRMKIDVMKIDVMKMKLNVMFRKKMLGWK